MDRTPKCDHSLESCGAVLYCGAVCFSLCNFGQFINFALGTVRSERVILIMIIYRGTQLSTRSSMMFQVHLFGASLGGFLAQKFAEVTFKSPRVQSLILCNAFADTSVFQQTATAGT